MGNNRSAGGGRQVRGAESSSSPRFSNAPVVPARREVAGSEADARIWVDEAQRITMFNHSAEKIFGYAAAEVLGAPLDVLVPDRLRAVHRAHVRRFAAGNEVSTHVGRPGRTVIARRKNGEEFA